MGADNVDEALPRSKEGSDEGASGATAVISTASEGAVTAVAGSSITVDSVAGVGSALGSDWGDAGDDCIAATAARISSQDSPDDVISEELEAEGAAVCASACCAGGSVSDFPASITGGNGVSSHVAGATSSTLGAEDPAAGGMRMGFSST